MAVGFFQGFDDIADFLGAVPAGYQQGIGSIHHDQVVHSQQRDGFAAGVDEIVVRVEHE